MTKLNVILKYQLWVWIEDNKKLIESSMTDSRPSIAIESDDQADALVKRWLGKE